MNRLTIILTGFAKATRLLTMAALIYQAGKYGLIFGVAGMPVIVLLLCALMILAFADVYRTISSIFKLNN